MRKSYAFRKAHINIFPVSGFEDEEQKHPAGHLQSGAGSFSTCVYKQSIEDDKQFLKIPLSDIRVCKDGLEVGQDLKKEFSMLKIMTMAGGGRRNDFSFLGISERLGTDRSLKKPFTQQEFLETIEELLRH